MQHRRSFAEYGWPLKESLCDQRYYASNTDDHHPLHQLEFRLDIGHRILDAPDAVFRGQMAKARFIKCRCQCLSFRLGLPLGDTGRLQLLNVAQRIELDCHTAQFKPVN